MRFIHKQILTEDKNTIVQNGLCKNSSLDLKDQAQTSSHKASFMKTWFFSVGVEELKYPAQSPELNPTDELWDELEL